MVIWPNFVLIPLHARPFSLTCDGESSLNLLQVYLWTQLLDAAQNGRADKVLELVKGGGNIDFKNQVRTASFAHAAVQGRFLNKISNSGQEKQFRSILLMNTLFALSCLFVTTLVYSGWDDDFACTC